MSELRAPGAAQHDQATGLEPVGSFVGRDDLFYQIEAAAQRERVIVLHGSGGTGKTELVKAFGRWWHDTGGVDRPEWVLWHSFEPGMASFGLDGVITEIGLRVIGSGFARMEAGQARAEIENLLARQRLLLIWDNFETVRSMMPGPGAGTPLLDEAGCQELRAFLTWLSVHGRSTVIATSRTAEDWLGPVCRIPVGGLTHEEAAEYAGTLLAQHPSAAPRRARRAFGELLGWLDGHPLSMRLILPHLARKDPEALLDGLRGAIPLPGEDTSNADRTSSLAASITYSFTHLTARTRRLLPAICLLRAVAATEVLTALSQEPGCPDRFARAGTRQWEAALDDAARVGLLTALTHGIYRIHPALPAYLAALWEADDPEVYTAAREQATHALVAACAAVAGTLRQEIESGDAMHAYEILDLQQHTLGAMFEYALASQLWAHAKAIAWPLGSYWDSRGLDQEAATWTSRMQLATAGADGTPPSLDSEAGLLWLLMTGSQANRQLRVKHIDDAERTHRQILAMLQAQPESPRQQNHLATAYHMLGAVAQYRQQPGQAEAWHRKSLAIREKSTNKRHTAASYQQLGIVIHRQGRLDEAEACYRKSLEIEEELGSQPGMALSYGQLGILARDRGQLQEAQDWYLKALPLFGELEDRPNLANIYLHLGDLARDMAEPDRAEDRYLTALVIFEELGDQHRISVSYHHLGQIAQDRGRLAEAEEWHRKCIDIEDALGDTDSLADSYEQLGLLAELQGNHLQALTWTIRRITMLGGPADPRTGPELSKLARLVNRLGIPVLEERWHEVTGNPPPQAVRNYIDINRPTGEGG